MKLFGIVVGLGVAAAVAVTSPAFSASCSPTPDPVLNPELSGVVVAGSCQTTCDGSSPFVSIVGVLADVNISTPTEYFISSDKSTLDYVRAVRGGLQ